MQSLAGHLTLSPSDLNDYVECPHLTTLELEVARVQRARPFLADEEADLLRRKGAEHEHVHLERLRAEGRAIVEIALGDPWDFEAAARRTVEAMRAGAEVISQATFVDGARVAPRGAIVVDSVFSGEGFGVAQGVEQRGVGDDRRRQRPRCARQRDQTVAEERVARQLVGDVGMCLDHSGEHRARSGDVS